MRKLSEGARLAVWGYSAGMVLLAASLITVTWQNPIDWAVQLMTRPKWHNPVYREKIQYWASKNYTMAAYLEAVEQSQNECHAKEWRLFRR